MTTTKIKAKYSNLNESNQKLIEMMVEKIVNRGNNDFLTGEVSKFIRNVSEITDTPPSTVNRIFYAYIRNESYETLKKLLVKEEISKKNPVATIRYLNKNVDAHEHEGVFYFVMDEMLECLPISQNNKSLRTAFSIKGRKVLTINGIKEQCVEVEKVKSFLQSFVKQLQESEQKNELRVFLESIHRLSPTGFVVNEPAKILEQKDVQIKKTEIKKNELIKAKKTKEIPLSVPIGEYHDLRAKISDVEKKRQTSLIVDDVKVQAEKIQKMNLPEDESLINGNEEIKTVIRMLNSIVFMTPESKNFLNQLIKENGLVKTVVSVSRMLDEVKDPSMLVMHMVEKKIKGCL